MPGTPLQFLVPLEQPPTLITTSVTTRPSSHREMFFHVEYWGLDFYHNSGTIDFLNLGQRVSFSPGDIGISPPNHDLRVVDVDDREEVYFGFEVSGSAEEGVQIPAIINVGDKFDMLHEMALDAVRSWPLARARSRALLWAILWEIARSHELANPSLAALHPSVRRAVEIVELELPTALSISALARRVALAPATLSRLFHRHRGMTLVAYIRRRRVERARFLLRHTDMPIKEIASRVGIPDLHVFNKAFRMESSVSPRSFRGQGPSAGGAKVFPADSMATKTDQ